MDPRKRRMKKKRTAPCRSCTGSTENTAWLKKNFAIWKATAGPGLCESETALTTSYSSDIYGELMDSVYLAKQVR